MIKELFPHDGFGYRLEYKDGVDKKICWFCHHTHVQKYLDRYKIVDHKIDIHPDYPPLTIPTCENKTVTKAKAKTKAKNTTKSSGKSTTKTVKPTPEKKLFADVDTYVKITPKETKRRSKAPKPINPGSRASDCPRVLQDRFKIKKNTK